MVAPKRPRRKRSAAQLDEETRIALEQASAESALARARQAPGAEAKTTEPPPPTAPGEEGTERRITFILRLTVDEQGQPRRTEIEHAQSEAKETFPGLDVQRLAAFMKKCINSQLFQNQQSPHVPP